MQEVLRDAVLEDYDSLSPSEKLQAKLMIKYMNLQGIHAEVRDVCKAVRSERETLVLVGTGAAIGGMIFDQATTIQEAMSIQRVAFAPDFVFWEMDAGNRHIQKMKLDGEHMLFLKNDA